MKSKKQMIHEMLASLPDEPAQHFDSGGELGSIGTNLSNTGFGGGGVNSPFINPIAGAKDTNASLAPQNGYNQVAPAINTQNYTGAINNGATEIGQGQQGLNTETGFLNTVAGQQGNAAEGLIQGPNSVLAQQQGLAGQLQATANGTGPNPAQTQYQQNIANNTSNTAGTLASEKGLSPALQARLIANNQAGGAQAAAGNAATTQAQQQIAAQQQLAAQQQAEAGTTTAAINGLGSQASTTNAAGGLQNDFGQLGTSQYGSAVSGNNAQNTNINQGVLGAGAINSGVAQSNTTAQGQLLGGVLNGLGGAASSALSAHEGGEIGKDGLKTPLTDQSAPAVAAQASPALSAKLMAKGGSVPGTPKVPHNDIKNDTVPAVLSPKEVVLPLDVTQAKDAPARAAAFVEALKKHTQPGYAKVLEARKKLADAHAKYQGGMITV